MHASSFQSPEWDKKEGLVLLSGRGENASFDDYDAILEPVKPTDVKFRS